MPGLSALAAARCQQQALRMGRERRVHAMYRAGADEAIADSEVVIGDRRGFKVAQQLRVRGFSPFFIWAKESSSI